MIIDVNFEDKVLACLFCSDEFCQSAARHLKPSHFDNPVKANLGKLGIDFYNNYKSKLSKVGFVEGIKYLVSKKIIGETDVDIYIAEYKRLIALDISDYRFILEKLILFIKNKETRRMIEEAVKKHLPKNDFAAIEAGMRDIAKISTAAEKEPYGYYEEASRVKRTKDREEKSLIGHIGISTGIKVMDDNMPENGFYKKNLYTFLAPPKAGKTMALTYFANIAALQEFNAAYFTLETSIEVLSDRLDAMNSNIEIKKLSTRFKDVDEKLKTIKTDGNLIFYEYPTKRLTVDEIENQLRKLEIERKTKVDILFVDYADIMRPARAYQDKLHEQASIYEDLRALASVFNIPVVTASQVNRVGSGKEIITGKDTSGTWEKIMVSDAIISLSASDADIKKGEMKIHFAECRNMERRTFRIKTAYNFGRFYKEYLTEEYSGVSE